MKHTVLTLTALLLATSAIADDGKPPSSTHYTGLSVFANAGAYWASNITANFYNGSPENVNTINRVLHSNTYGTAIWNNLVGQGLISPSAIGSYNQLQVVEYSQRMYYRTSYQIGVGLRYDYASGFGWLLRFDLARLQAIGGFNLSAANGASLPGTNQYIPCEIMGREKRINIDLALTRTVPLSPTLELELDLGATLVNTQVQDNIMQIGGQTYSILDRWDGRTPDAGVAAYENNPPQGGIGYGVFSSLLLGYRVNGIGAFKVGYTCYQTKTVLKGYTAWGWHHMLGIRIEMNNFKI